MKNITVEDEYLKIDDCIHGSLYKIDARNFSLGVYSKIKQGFVGIRYKFGSEYLSIEFHWDTGTPYGTAKPLEYIEECPHEVSDGNKDLFEWLKEKREEYL
jgi:hypothetical protein